MDRLEAMALLVSSAEEGSFSAAGRKLGVSLPTISRKVAELEEHLKTRLLVRSGRKLVMTDAGVAYVEACRQILREVQEAESRASGEYSVPRGELTVTAPVVFGRLHILPVVCEFLAAFAEIKVRMTLTDRNLSLVEDQIDMAVRIGELADNSQIATRVGSVRRVVCGSPAYFATHGVPQTPEELVRHVCITFTGIHSGVSWLFASNGGARRVISPMCRLYVNSGEAAVAAAIAGVGITNVISYQAAPAVREGKLQIILAEYEPVAIPVHMLHSKKGRLPLKMRRFIEFATPRIRKSLLEVGGGE
ncbi:MAG: LysR family transcriptional regulator [Gammaproteobacteria bacterium]|jgi:DNA-binding transcriptional LysR family regulator|nr:LysR family transcriptional regulator [Gammaproteobacteria bacterium]